MYKQQQWHVLCNLLQTGTDYPKAQIIYEGREPPPIIGEQRVRVSIEARSVNLWTAMSQTHVQGRTRGRVGGQYWKLHNLDHQEPRTKGFELLKISNSLQHVLCPPQQIMLLNLCLNLFLMRGRPKCLEAFISLPLYHSMFFFR